MDELWINRCAICPRKKHLLPCYGIALARAPMYVKNVSAEKEKTRTDARIPCSHEHEPRQARAFEAEAEGAPFAHRVTPPVLPKQRRLPVQEVIRKKPAAAFRGKFFLLQFFHAAQGAARVGVLVAKGVVTKASSRNELRRRAFAAARLHLAGLPAGSYLVIVLARAAGAEPRSLAEDLANLFSEAAAALPTTRLP